MFPFSFSLSCWLALKLWWRIDYLNRRLIFLFWNFINGFYFCNFFGELFIFTITILYFCLDEFPFWNFFCCCWFCFLFCFLVLTLSKIDLKWCATNSFFLLGPSDWALDSPDQKWLYCSTSSSTFLHFFTIDVHDPSCWINFITFFHRITTVT